MPRGSNIQSLSKESAGGGGRKEPPMSRRRSQDERVSVPSESPALLELTSATFKNGDAIPRTHTQDGADGSPPLAWSPLPSETRSVALLMDDPDVPGGQPFVHWILFNLPP